MSCQFQYLPHHLDVKIDAREPFPESKIKVSKDKSVQLFYMFSGSKDLGMLHPIIALL